MIKKLGNDLFWNHNLKKQILSFLYIDNYSLNDLSRLTGCTSEMVLDSISLLKKDQLILDKNSSNNETYSITLPGDTYIKANFEKQAPKMLNHLVKSKLDK